MMKGLFIIAALLPLGVLANQPTASRTLPAGTVIGLEDVILEDGTSIYDTNIIGLQTRTIIYEGKPIHPARLIPPTLISRNQIVPITYETPLMVIQTEGRALEPGQIGQTIRVMNLSSKATISGRVSPDGTVKVSGQ